MLSFPVWSQLILFFAKPTSLFYVVIVATTHASMYKDYYKILGLPATAGKDELQKAYRTIAEKWHPDVNTSAEVKERMHEAMEAYLVLEDQKSRKLYDKIYQQVLATNNGQTGNSAATKPVDIQLEKAVLKAQKRATNL